MDGPWRIELLGGLRVTLGDRVITRFRTQKTGALLAYLAYNMHRLHPRDELIELHWPEADPQAGRNSLRVALSSLRRQLEPPGVPTGAVLISSRASVQLNPIASVTDIEQFERALQGVTQAENDVTRAQWLTQAVGLYQGELLLGYFESWIVQERQRLAEEFHRALSELAALLEQNGDLHGAIQIVRRAVSADPLREEGHRELMRLLAAAGQPEAALCQYRELKQLIAQQLGVSPENETLSLANELALLVGQRRETDRQGRHDGSSLNKGPSDLNAEVPSFLLLSPASRGPTGTAILREPLPSHTASPHGNLPLQFTRFFGREPEIARLLGMLQGCTGEDGSTREARGLRPRLVTLTGPGGSGKTRLALAVAQRLVEMWRSPTPRTGCGVEALVWFVPLAELADARRIVDLIRDALRLPPSGTVEPLEQVVLALTDLTTGPMRTPAPGGAPAEARGQPAPTPILLLDNFEHLVADGAPIVRSLLERIPALTCLVTSRRRLDLPGEHEFPVHTLATPNGNATPEELSRCESVQLFVDRAQAVRPDFQVTAANAAAVAALCERLEGIPLALELAASRARALTLGQMLAQLEQRFDFLVSRQRTAAARHRTLRTAVDWSYRLLSPEAQRFYARLSVFRGGWSQAAAEAVCEEPLALQYLEQLLECSLVMADEGPEAMRFRILETLREYAREQLESDARDSLARRHVAYYLALAEQADARFDEGPDQARWLHHLEQEQENLRAALEWAEADGELEVALRLGGAMSAFWGSRGYMTEGRERMAGLLASAAASGRTPARAKALCVLGMLAFYQGDFPAARPPLKESVAIWRELGDERGAATSLGLLGQVASCRGDYAAAESLYDESLALRRPLGNPQLIAHSLTSLGEVALCQGDHATARAQLEESLAIFRQFGDKHSIAYSLNHLGEVGRYQGDHSAARSHVEESLAILRELGDKHCVARSLYLLGKLAYDRADYAAARSHYEESLTLRREFGTKWEIVECVEGLAGLAGIVGRPERAVRLFGAAKALREATGAPLPPNRQPEQEAQVAVLRVTLGEAVFLEAWTAGQMLTWEHVMVDALEEPGTV